MNLPKNVGNQDRNIRYVAAGLFILAGILTNTWLMTVIGLILLITAATGTCLAYIPLKMDTRKPGEGGTS